MSKIYELPLSYRLTRKYVNFTFRQFYSEYIILGKENIPTEGPVIFAPNHLNALMDALAVLSVTSNRHSTVFLARSDMFKKPVVARFLTFAKIMPAFRIRDGIENLGKNAEIFERCVEVLETNNAMGIMPEGNQELERKIRPLVKGIFRVAFSAQVKAGNSKSIKIIPVGIDMGSLTKSCKHIIINVGKPIDVADYMDEYNLNPVAATNKIRDDLKLSLENQVLHLDTENYYKTFETATAIVNIPVLEALKLTDTTVNRFYARQETGKRLVKMEKENPADTEKLNLLCTEFDDLSKKLNIHISNFDRKPLNFSQTLISILAFALLSPLFLTGLLFNFFPFLSPVFIRKKMNVKFEGFFTSLQYGTGILTFPVFYMLQSALLTSFTGLAWYYFFILIPIEFLTWKPAIVYYKKFRKFIGLLRHQQISKQHRADFGKLINLRNAIIGMIVK